MNTFAPLGSFLQQRIWLLALLLPALSGGSDPRELRPADRPRPGSGDRVEHFLLEWSGERPHPARDWDGPQAQRVAARRGRLGLVEIRCTRADANWQLEQEIWFPFEGIRVLAVECLDPKSPRLVWREIAVGSGRTVFAEWTKQSEELRALEWGVDGSLRETKGTRAGAVMPHYLLELARRGRVVGGAFEVFDPLARDLDRWELTTSYRPEGREFGDSPRVVEFRRQDGTLAGRYTFRGTSLVAFQWQEGQVRARRITAEAYDELLGLWGLDPGADEERKGEIGVKDV